MSGNSPGCSKSLMLAKAFIWTVAGALRPKRDCLRSEHERDYDLGMDALVRICSWNTKGIMVWAWMLWSAYALGTRSELWFGHGCSGQRTHRNTNGIMVWAWMLWSAHSSKHERNYGLGMDALVSVCSWNTKGNMVWAWMLWSACALGTRREIWFGHGCSGQRMLLEHEGNYGLGMDALVSALIETRTEIWFGQRCSGQRTHRNTTGIKVWAWMLWSAHSSKHERNYGLGMDALVSVMLLEHVQTYWPSQYFVKVVSCRSARYTVRFSESRIPDESKFLHFAETQTCRQHQHFAHFQALENARNTARASKFGLGRGH